MSYYFERLNVLPYELGMMNQNKILTPKEQLNAKKILSI